MKTRGMMLTVLCMAAMLFLLVVVRAADLRAASVKANPDNTKGRHEAAWMIVDGAQEADIDSYADSYAEASR